MEDTDGLFRSISKLLDSQNLGVLGTCGTGGPYCSLVGFSQCEDLKQIYFATTRATRKYSNLSETGKASLIVDNRGNRPEDLHETEAVTATGTTRELKGQELDTAREIHLAKHPYLTEFVNSPTSAIFAIDVEGYFLVRRFQNVMVLKLER